MIRWKALASAISPGDLIAGACGRNLIFNYFRMHNSPVSPQKFNSIILSIKLHPFFTQACRKRII